jgi:putative oxidoreductase
MDKLQSAAALAGRLAIAWIFALEGTDKIIHYAGVGAYMEANGVSSALLPLVILTEFGGGILVALGFFTRFAALALAGFCVLAAVLFHWNFADAGEWINFNKDIAIAGGFLALAAFGAGDWSLDAWTRWKVALSGRPSWQGQKSPGESASP